MARETRKITNKVYDALAEGTLSWQAVAEAALAYMSEDEIADMAHDTDDDADDFLEDFNSTGSRHHY